MFERSIPGVSPSYNLLRKKWKQKHRFKQFSREKKKNKKLEVGMGWYMKLFIYNNLETR